MRQSLSIIFGLWIFLSFASGSSAEIGEINVNAGPAEEKAQPEDKSALWIESKTRAILLLIDDHGKRVGIDPKNRKTLHEIPNSQCETDFLTNRYTGEEQVGVYEHITMQPARRGRYKILLRGLQDGPFEVNISALSKEGSSLPYKQLEGLISEKEVKTFQLTYDSDSRSQLTVVESQKH